MQSPVSILWIFPVLILLSLSLVAQQKTASGVAPGPVPKVTSKNKPKPTLTPEQGKGLKLLEAAEVESAGMSPAVRAYVLLSASRGYARLNPNKLDSILEQAFLTTRSIENPTPDDPTHCLRMSLACDIKGWLQGLVLDRIRARAADKVEALLPSAEPEVRKRITQQLIGDYAAKKNFDRAKELLDQFTDGPEYPYKAAFHLMRDLPEERAGERMVIFAQALRSFHDYPPDASPGFGDFATLVVRYWQQLPPAMVMDAIDAILAQAKDKNNPQTQFRVGIAGSKGEADFTNAYEFRVFELLPIIRQLDNSKAESLLRENVNVALLLRAHPNGLQSLGGDRSKDSTLGIHSISYATGDNPMEAAVNQALVRQEQQINERLEQIENEARKNPKQALQDAMNLPAVSPWGDERSSPRILALHEVAAASTAQAPATAKAAVEEELKLVDGLAPSSDAIVLGNRADLLVRVAETYHRLGDQDSARNALRRAFKIAEKIYAVDSDPGDPNRAFKGAWPSAHVWERIVKAAAEISPDFLEDIWSEIADPEIMLMVKTAYANSLLQAPPGFMPMLEVHKKGVSGAMSAD